MKPLTEGIWQDIPADAYHADPCPEPSLSSSIAKLIANQTPMHGKLAHTRLNKKIIVESTAAMEFGSVCHSLLLEDGKGIEIVPFDSYRSKDAKAAKEEAIASGMIPIKIKEYEKAVTMTEIAKDFWAMSPSLEDYPQSSGTAENTLVWSDSSFGHKIWCRSRVDWISNDKKLIVDYKTTTDANPEGNKFIRSMIDYGYDVQHAFYLWGCDILFGEADLRDPRQFVFLVQEKTAPYMCSLVTLDMVFTDGCGQPKLEVAIKRWSDGMKTGKWPGYSRYAIAVTPPVWAVWK